MAGESSPRQSVKALVKGKRPDRPWLFPLLFSLGSRLESLTPREFFLNPTKIASALKQIRTTLKVDGLACYCDAFLESEAGGCSLDWAADGPSLAAGANVPDVETIRRQLGPTENIVGKGRIKVAAEVVRRLKPMLQDEPALLVRVTGPLTLAQRFFHSQLSTRCPASENELEFAAEITAALSRHFVEAGADVVFLVEETLPLADVEGCERWGGLLDPIINVIRFYEALPVLLFGDLDTTAEKLDLVCTRNWECVLCPALPGAKRVSAARWRSQAAATGIAVPINMLASGSQELTASVLAGAEELRPVLVTTSADVPASADLKQVGAAISCLREALCSIT